MNILNDVIAYLTEYSKLFLTAFQFFNFTYISKKRNIIITVASTALIAVLSLAELITMRSMLIMFITFISLYIMLREKRNMLHCILIYIYIYIIDMVLNNFIMFILNISISDIKRNNLCYHLLNMSYLIIIMILTGVKYYRHKSTEYKFSRNYTVTFAVTGFAIAFYLTSFWMFAFSDTNVMYRRLAALALGTCSIVFIFTINLQTKSLKSRCQSLEQEKVMIEKMMTSIEQYYLILLKKESETKAFRHDFKSHLHCISVLYSEGKYQDGKKYIDRLTNNFEHLRNDIDTGNNLVNAIITDIAMSHSDVSVDLKGHIPEKLAISPYDICTILSNVLKNAFEAANATDDKLVNITMKIFGNNINMTITNHYSFTPVKNGDNFVSVKAPSGRGYGIHNVRNCIKRINGDFCISFENGIAVARITLFNAICSDSKITETTG